MARTGVALVCTIREPALVVGQPPLGGYPVLKKWLGYRQANRREGRPLSLEEAGHVTSIVQRLSALLALGPELDAFYEAAAADAWSVEELGLG